MPNPTAAILIIGDEILSGRTRDANMHYLAGELTRIGIDLSEARVVADDHAAIVAALNELRARYGHVFTSGGIGPTHDDITAEAIAAAFGVPHRRARRCPRAARRPLRAQRHRVQRRPPAHGPHPRGRGADRQPGVDRAGLQPWQCPCHGRGAEHLPGDGRLASAAADRRAAAAQPDACGSTAARA